MVILLHGQDTYRIHERMLFLRRAFEQKFASSNPHITTWQGGDLNPEHLHASVHNTGLFAQKMCIVLLHAEDVRLDARASIESILQATPEDVVVIITYTAPKKSPWATLVPVANKQEEYALLDDAHLRTYIRTKAKEHSVTLTPAELNQLIIGTEGNLWDSMHCLHQLKHVPENARLNILSLFIPSTTQSTVFALLDALSEKNLHKALLAYEDQRRSDASVHGLITLLAKHIGLLYHACVTPNAPTDAHPFALKKATSAARRFTPEHLRSLLNELLSIDTALKSSTIDEHALITLFLTKACA